MYQVSHCQQFLSKEVLNPMINNAHLLLEFMEFVDLFNQPSKQKKIPASSPIKLKQIFLTQLTAILTDADVSFGKLLLDSISNFIHKILEGIAVSERKEELIQELIIIFSPDQHQKAFSASRTTVQEHLPALTKHQLDRQLEQDYQKQMQMRKAHHAKSAQVTLAIDYSHERTSSKHRNNQHTYVRIGQRKIWEQGFNYSSVYDATHQMFLGLIHHNDHKIKRDRRTFQPWITHLRDKILAVERAGSQVTLIEADRGYFDSEFFALSHLGLLRGVDMPRKFIRVITPRKFSRNKEDSMWTYLLSENSMQVSTQTMNLNYYSPQPLIQACDENAVPYADGIYHIPVAQVVLIDEYGATKQKTFEEAKEAAKQIQKQLELRKERLEVAEMQYSRFKTKGKDSTYRLKYRRNRRRKKFRNSEEERLYTTCYELHDQLRVIEARKQDLLHSIMFFYVSIAPNEDPSRYPEKYIHFAKDYHERWGIENGFRDTKQKFLHNSRSQKPTRRQFYWVQGLMLYNRWQSHKCLDMLAQERKRVHNIVPWDSRRAHIRKKLEKTVRTEWSAKAYLLCLWETGLRLCLEDILKT